MSESTDGAGWWKEQLADRESAHTSRIFQLHTGWATQGQELSSDSKICKYKKEDCLDLVMNKRKLMENLMYKKVLIFKDLTNLSYKLFKYAKEKNEYTFISDGKVICKKDGKYIAINNLDDLFLIGNLFFPKLLELTCSTGSEYKATGVRICR